jgi:2-polyprenyl-3-methyl-5-hydroxy-6-metoxy-1,4-benzoquinol methylase
MLNRLKSFHYSRNYPQYIFYESIVSAFKQLCIPLDKRFKVADLPCGHGEFTYNLASNPNLEIDAVDLSESYINHAKTYFQRDNIKYAVADINAALKGKEDQYDMVFIINSLFLLTQHELFLRNSYASLKQGGKLFVVIPNIHSENFKAFQRLDTSLNILMTSREETIDYISSFGFRHLLSADLVYASFYKRKEVRFMGPLSNLYLILLNKIYSALKKNIPSYHLLVLEK